MTSGFEPKFGGAADAYQRYRPDYPQALYDHILSRVPRSSRNRAMDLGAGTGIATGPLVEWFREVIAVEPDDRMAKKIGERLPQVAVRNVTSEECVQDPESIDLITIANALHWMEPAPTFANIRKWLRHDAVLAVFDRPLPKGGEAVDEIVRGELRGPWKPFRHARLKRHLDGPKTVRSAVGFLVVDESKFSDVIPMNPADYTGFWRSSSYGSAYARTLPDPESYWGELKTRFAVAAGDDMIFADFSPTLVLARRS